MKKILILALAFATLASTGYANTADEKAKEKTEKAVKAPKKEKAKKAKKGEKTEEIVVLANAVDSMSYALGANVGADFLTRIKTLPGGQYNIDLFLKSFNATMKGDSVVMKAEFIQEFLNTYFAAAQKKDADVKKVDGEKFLAENASKPGVKTTLTGLQYEIIKDAEGPKPAATDKVKVHYEGTLLDGTKFDSSYDRGEPIEFQLDQVIKGWTEGVQLMSPGAKYKFYIPYNLAYGEQGTGGVIPPYATLTFVVELIEINPVSIKDQVKELEIK